MKYDKIVPIVLTLNEEPRIKRCLTPLLKYFDHVCVVDGGSTDKTMEIVRSLPVTVLENENKDLSVVRNMAETYMDFWHDDIKYFLHVDPDELWHTQFFLDLHKIMGLYAYNWYRDVFPENDTLVFAFPRINLPDKKKYPDYQVRMIKNVDFLKWKSFPHERVMDRDRYADKVNCVILDQYPIIHFKRREDINREWW